ncbi:hypothetical protein [Pseudonocardia lacus]|uniref:hypothetical protein n=1 Tax=Pseudonocardia lacus TaxID=2835865 RepID=UPI001BDDC1F8|nr:hypothetical protein [Pseudonocardia lacus]
MPVAADHHWAGHLSYAPPTTDPVQLSRRPRLASWDAAGHPAQLALADFLDHAELDLREHLRAEPPWTLELVVGLPATVPLLDHHDLDNYLHPLAQRLGGQRLVAVRAAKGHSPRSAARLDTARSALPPGRFPVHHVRTTASAGTTAYKRQIHGQLSAAGAGAPPPGAALSAVVSFRHGPGRNWLNLWKPTLDALGPLIGEGSRPWNPRDGAIVELAMHSTTDPLLGWDVEICIAVGPGPTRRALRPD